MRAVPWAKNPGGADFSALEKQGVLCRKAPGLPGKYAPLSAARAIRDTLHTIWEEEIG